MLNLRMKSLLVVVTMLASGVAHSAGLTWAKDFNAAVAQAKRSRGYVMVDFTAVWCVNCHKLDRTTYSDPGVVKFLNGAVPVRVDFDKQPQLAKKYKVTALPVILFLNASGQELGRISKYVAASDFIAAATPIIKKANK